eukprot:TRINITY_DN32880_c0_g1_i1.p1 TRINITY_DN32880_c0_g1~~TRINITY_DN32880_c0_g1_i1.p1  ORF type:complete len:280 (+),score=76.59 TRINITY_DN32880_c0_g1_i1:44-841(+)
MSDADVAAATEFVCEVYRERCPEVLRYLPALLQKEAHRAREVAAVVASRCGVPPPPWLAGAPPPAVRREEAAPDLPVKMRGPMLSAIDDLRGVIDDKDTIIRAQRDALQSGARTLLKHRREAVAHAQAVHRWTDSQRRHARAIEQLLNQIREVKNPDARVRADTPSDVPVAELGELCDLLGVSVVSRAQGSVADRMRLPPPPPSFTAVLEGASGVSAAVRAEAARADLAARLARCEELLPSLPFPDADPRWTSDSGTDPPTPGSV